MNTSADDLRYNLCSHFLTKWSEKDQEQHSTSDDDNIKAATVCILFIW